MKTRLLIILVIVTLVIISFFATIFYLQNISSGEQQDMCLENKGKWDYVHETCDYIDLISCTLMNGIHNICKPREYKCALDAPICEATEECIETCIFDQSTRAKVMDDGGDILETFFSPVMEIKNCNILGNPDGECFVKAYDECQSAIIKQSIHTMEGDPIFFYAQVLSDSCTIQFVIDDRYDKHGSDKAITEKTCRNAQLLENSISFLCGDDIDGYGFSLK